MSAFVLKILLFVYILYSLLKFFEFFYRSEKKKQEGLEMVYEKGNGKIIQIFDTVILILMILFLVLLAFTGVEYLSFTTGLLVGMTLIQVYFHRFSKTIPPEKSPKPPITALKLMSYSIQAQPGNAWRELVFMTVLFLWALYKLATEGFGWFH